MDLKANQNYIDTVYANGVEIETIYLNNELVWERPEPLNVWKKTWSGLAYITDFDGSKVEDEKYSYSYLFTGISYASLQGHKVQADAVYVENINGEDYIADVLTAERNDYDGSTNLPWNARGVLSGLLSELICELDTVYIEATCYATNVWDVDIYGYFIVTNIWYHARA